MFDLENARGLTVSVYRTSRFGDCTAGGASGKVDQFTVVGVVRAKATASRGKERELISPLSGDARVFSPRDDAPAAVLCQSQLDGAPPHLVPLDVWLSGAWSMHGGNIADTSDSRWADAVSSFLPHGVRVSSVDIHDRVER